MARPRQHIPLNVFLNGRLVGRLNRQSRRAIDFQYDPSWLAWEHALPCRCLYISTSARGRENGSLKDPKTLWLGRLSALYCSL